MDDHQQAASQANNTSRKNKRDLSVSMARANFVGPLLILPPFLTLALAYILLWGVDVVVEASFWELAAFYAVALVVLIVGVVAHELLHSFSFVLIGKQPLENVKLLGFQWKTLTPYSSCRVPVRAWAYRWVVAIPGLVLGVAPSLAGIITGNGWVMLYGLFFFFAAAGDALILWLLRGIGGDELVEDHPERAGCYVLEG